MGPNDNEGNYYPEDQQQPRPQPPGDPMGNYPQDRHSPPPRRSVERRDDIGDDPAMRLIMPVGLSVWAIVAGYLGLLSLACFPGPLAVIAGILAIMDMKKNPKKHGMFRAIFGIVMGSIATLGLILMVIALLVDRP